MNSQISANAGRATGTATSASRLLEADDLACDYLETLKRALTGTIHQDTYLARPAFRGSPMQVRGWLGELLVWLLRRRGLEAVRRCSRETLEHGRARPLVGETMVGLERLENLQRCIEHVVRQRVPGDLIETGVWRGGASIFMRGVLRALGVTDRCVWVADSFAGLPPPDPDRFPADADDRHHRVPELAVPLAAVQENFRRYGLLDEQVRFLEGWFRDTLPQLRDERWSVIRLDGDMYESTMATLTNLYPRLSPGGFLIVDDGALAPCRAAVDEFRSRHAISEPIEWIDWTGFFWQRQSS